jgi:hypothetical protein
MYSNDPACILKETEAKFFQRHLYVKKKLLLLFKRLASYRQPFCKHIMGGDKVLHLFLALRKVAGQPFFKYKKLPVRIFNRLALLADSLYNKRNPATHCNCNL